MMVSLKMDAEARAKVKGSEDMEKYPIVAKVKGTGKDGGLSIHVSGDSPISATVGGNGQDPIAITSPDIQGMIDTIANIAENLSVKIENDKTNPLAITLGKIPIDLSIAVHSPAEESVFKIEIKGSIGD
jgi:hypothetical protein